MFNHIQFPVLPTLHKLCCVARYTPFILTIAWCNPISLPINIIHTCFSKRSQALGAASLPHTTFQTRAISSSCNALQSEQLYSQQCRHHSLPFQLKQLSKFPKRETPTQFRLSFQHLLIFSLNRPRKARATHHPPPTSPANGKPSHEPGLTEAPGGRRGPRNQLVTGSARASRTTKWQHGWQRASGRRLGTALDISEARAGTGGRGPA